MEPLGGWKRTHTCGELNHSHVNQLVTLMGWIHRRRDHGGLIFVDLRDRYGITQIIFDSQVDSNTYERARQLRNEFVVAIKGYVRRRPAEMINPNRSTGEIEIETHEIKILNEAITTPFPIVDQVDATEENRLKYRYLDLRRSEMQTNLILRHRLYQLARNYFTKSNFIEIETPYLMKSTPEGARDYLVPSRNYKGRFYALPQSPQTYKQLLMVAGFDRYFQIVRCFRDEDLRSDRQPEFTQIDVEMSFVEPEDIYSIMEGFMKEVFREFFQEGLKTPIPRLTFAEAQMRFGSDKPDLRFGMEIATVTELVKNAEFKVFRQAVENHLIVCGICLKNGAGYSRKRMDELNSYILEAGGKGLVQIKVSENGWDSSLTKFFTPTEILEINKAMQAMPGDLLFFVADEAEKAYTLMGNLRLKLAREENLIDKDKHQLLWIVDFPLLEYSPEEKRYVSRHHPFTSPMDEDIPQLAEKPAEVRAKAYDLVLDGYEIAGGSIRIHSRDLQKEIFKVLKIETEEAEQKFGFLMDAFQYGAPPHGGIAFGFDRLAMLLAGRTSLRDVIAFPKTTSALSLMDNAPTSVSPIQLKELGLILERSEEERE
ncbi:aspartate--tRNA ligase [candidate division KSB1 bacterium]|nr:aspartate--tRNA ligase [candidate division KSB1 bacterium]